MNNSVQIGVEPDGVSSHSESSDEEVHDEINLEVHRV